MKSGELRIVPAAAVTPLLGRFGLRCEDPIEDVESSTPRTLPEPTAVKAAPHFVAELQAILAHLRRDGRGTL